MKLKVYRHKRNRNFYEVKQGHWCSGQWLEVEGEFVVTRLLGGAEGVPTGTGQPRTQEQLDRLYTPVDLDRTFAPI